MLQFRDLTIASLLAFVRPFIPRKGIIAGYFGGALCASPETSGSGQSCLYAELPRESAAGDAAPSKVPMSDPPDREAVVTMWAGTYSHHDFWHIGGHRRP